MSLIPGKHFVDLEHFPASLKVRQQLNYWLHWTFKNQNQTL